MGLISETLSGMQSVSLAGSQAAGKPIGIPLGVKSTQRVKREELETDYRFDAVTFNIINKQLELILHAGFQIKAKTDRWQKFYDEFFDNIGFVGEPITKEELVEYTIQDMLMYGNAFVELIYDSSDNKIVDLKLLPEKKMDYAKNIHGEIVVDRLGRPVGYIMQLPFGHTGRGMGDQPPEEFRDKISIASDQIFFLPKRIAHFKLHTYGERFYGVGIIEPSHKSTWRKMMLEDARTNEIYTRGSNTIIANVGDENHEPGPQEIQDTLDQIANFKYNRYFSFPYWVKIDTLPIQDNSIVDNSLDYLKTNQTASAGMPRAMATGEGETANKQTLDVMNFTLELSLEHVVKKFASAFKKYVLRPIAETNRVKEIADIQFGDVIAEDKGSKAERLSTYIRNGALAPEEVRPYIFLSEDVEENSEAYERYRDSAKAKPKKLPSAPFPSEDSEDGQPDTENMSQEELRALELGGFYMPQQGFGNIPGKPFARKDMTPLNNMTEEEVTKVHQNLHILWRKLEEGYQINWTFEQLKEEHDKVLDQMKQLNLVHITPINELDRVSNG